MPPSWHHRQYYYYYFLPYPANVESDCRQLEQLFHPIFVTQSLLMLTMLKVRERERKRERNNNYYCRITLLSIRWQAYQVEKEKRENRVKGRKRRARRVLSSAKGFYPFTLSLFLSHVFPSPGFCSFYSRNSRQQQTVANLKSPELCFPIIIVSGLVVVENFPMHTHL